MEPLALERALERAESEYREISQKVRVLCDKSNAEFKLAETGRKELEHLYISSSRILHEADDLCRVLLPLEAEIKRLKASPDRVALDPGKRNLTGAWSEESRSTRGLDGTQPSRRSLTFVFRPVYAQWVA